MSSDSNCSCFLYASTDLRDEQSVEICSTVQYYILKSKLRLIDCKCKQFEMLVSSRAISFFACHGSTKH